MGSDWKVTIMLAFISAYPLLCIVSGAYLVHTALLYIRIRKQGSQNTGPYFERVVNAKHLSTVGNRG